MPRNRACACGSAATATGVPARVGVGLEDDAGCLASCGSGLALWMTVRGDAGGGGGGSDGGASEGEEASRGGEGCGAEDGRGDAGGRLRAAMSKRIGGVSCVLSGSACDGCWLGGSSRWCSTRNPCSRTLPPSFSTFR
jgi:hypothetical protein